MQKKYDAVATVGKYTNKQGEEKKRYVTVGAVFEDDHGRLSLKLDSFPCAPEWSGWVSFYDPKPYEGNQQQSSQPKPEPRNLSVPSNRQTELDDTDADSIPF